MLLFDAYHDEYRWVLPCWVLLCSICVSARVCPASLHMPFVAGVSPGCCLMRTTTSTGGCYLAVLTSSACRAFAVVCNTALQCAALNIVMVQVPPTLLLPLPLRRSGCLACLTNSARPLSKEASSSSFCCSGVVCLVEVKDGRVQKGDRITAASTGAHAVITLWHTAAMLWSCCGHAVVMLWSCRGLQKRGLHQCWLRAISAFVDAS